MEQRMAELRAELEKGQREIEALDRRRQEVRDTMLRIGGAIQVLQELMANGTGSPGVAEPTHDAAVAQAGVR